MRSPYFFMASSDSVNPNPGASFKVSHPSVISGAFSYSSACKGSRAGKHHWRILRKRRKHPTILINASRRRDITPGGGFLERL
ncbi:MAG: hypothetical protein VB913_12125 [Rhodospirillales bacterium]